VEQWARQERFLKQKSDFEGNISRTHLNDLESAFNGALRQEEELLSQLAQADLLHLRPSQP